MNDYVVRLRVAQNVWQAYQVVAMSAQEAHAAAENVYSHQFGLPLYDHSASIVALGEYNSSRIVPVPVPSL